MTTPAHTTDSGLAANLPALVYKGHVIHERHEMLSLTDMWRAGGAPGHREPFNWARKEGAPFIEAVALALNLPVGQVLTKKAGRGGGTFAHWQVALAYAKYLDHDFHMWCNTVVRERMERRAGYQPVSITESDRLAIGDIVAAVLRQAVPAMVAAELSMRSTAIRRGKTAGQIWKENGLPAMRNGGWFSRRLSEMGCALDGGGCGELGDAKARLFDPDKAAVYMRNGGRLAAERYVAGRNGQGVLRLVPPPAVTPTA